MSEPAFHIVKYEDRYRQPMVDVWEQSVKATHLFLQPADFAEIKALVQSLDFHALDVYCLLQGSALAGFVGVAGRKVEMLFLAPQYFGQGPR